MSDTVMISLPVTEYEDLIKAEVAVQAIRQAAASEENTWSAMAAIRSILAAV